MSLQDNEHIKHRSDDSELVFTDVIKNISRVNNVLQELIDNYEQLKKMYKSQENSETEESGTEVDGGFKAKGNDGSETTQRAQLGGDFPATQMFWSNDEKDSISASDDDEKDKNSEKNASAKDITEKIGENSSSDTSTGESTDISTDKEEHNHKTKKTKPGLRQKPEIVPIGTTKKTAEVKPKMIKSNPVKTNNYFDPKTTQVYKEVNNSRGVQKVVYAELFSKNNIWDDIFKNKPIQLQRSHVDYQSAVKPGNGTEPIGLNGAGTAKSAIQDINANKVSTKCER